MSALAQRRRPAEPLWLADEPSHRDVLAELQAARAAATEASGDDRAEQAAAVRLARAESAYRAATGQLN